jgi:hypothetical protein
MGKYKRCFQDYAEQCFYEDLRRDGMSKEKAVKETSARFRAYDEGRDIIFVK